MPWCQSQTAPETPMPTDNRKPAKYKPTAGLSFSVNSCFRQNAIVRS